MSGQTAEAVRLLEALAQGERLDHTQWRTLLEARTPALAAEAARILAQNKSERHLRGGNATKLKYEISKYTKKKG